MLRLAAGQDEITRAAQALVVLLNDPRAKTDGSFQDTAVRILQPFSVDERLMIGVEALENGADLAGVRSAISIASPSPAEAQRVTEIIELNPVYRTAFKMQWWQSMTAKVAGAAALAVVGWMLYQKKRSPVSIR